MSEHDDPAKAQKTDYRDVRDVGLDDGKRERLYDAQTECCVMWTNRDGWPIGVMHRFVWRDGRFWVTCTAERLRVPALRARPQSCVVVSSEGTWLGGDVTTTAATMATVHDDAATKAWFYPALAARVRPDDTKQQAAFAAHLDSPNRIVIEIVPDGRIGFDAEQMFKGSAAGPSRTQV